MLEKCDKTDFGVEVSTRSTWVGEKTNIEKVSNARWLLQQCPESHERPQMLTTLSYLIERDTIGHFVMKHTLSDIELWWCLSRDVNAV